MASESYIYNPAASISKQGAETANAITGAFAQIIASKQEDMQLANQVFTNLEAIKKDTAAIGAARINKKVNDIVGSAANVMFKDGKISYEGIAQVRKKAEEIKNEKVYWNGASELKKEAYQLGSATHADLTSLPAYLANVDKLIADGAGQDLSDLQKKIAQAYDQNLDYSKAAREKVLTRLPVQTITGESENAKGGTDKYSFEAPQGMKFNPKTRNIVMGEDQMVSDEKGIPVIDPVTGLGKRIRYIDRVKSALSDGDPTYFDKYRNHFGLSKALVSDDAIAMDVLDSIKKNKTVVESKSATERQIDANRLKTTGVEANYAEENTVLGIKTKKANLRLINANIDKSNRASAGTGSGGNKFGAIAAPLITKQSNGNKKMTMTQPIKLGFEGTMGMNKVTGKKDLANTTPVGELDIQEVYYNPNKNQYAVRGYQEGLKDKYGSALPKKLITKLLSESEVKSFISRVGGLPKAYRIGNAQALKAMGMPIPMEYINSDEGGYNITRTDKSGIPIVEE